MSEDPAPPTDPEPEEEQRQTTPFLVLQFFVFPMAIVAACVAVFVVFGLISSDAKTARDHLADVRRGGGMFGVKRWQAAFAFASALDSEKAETKRDPELVKETLALFEESKNDDPRVRRYLALALGRMRDPAAVPALLGGRARPAGRSRRRDGRARGAGAGRARRSRRGTRPDSARVAAGRRAAQGGAAFPARLRPRGRAAARCGAPWTTPWRTSAGTRRSASRAGATRPRRP